MQYQYKLLGGYGMTNPKIEKINASIEKIKANISREQSKLRELERRRTALEDAEIVARFRKENLTEDDLNIIIKQKSGDILPVLEIPDKYAEFKESEGSL
jgi:hypothetical protein